MVCQSHAMTKWLCCPLTHVHGTYFQGYMSRKMTKQRDHKKPVDLHREAAPSQVIIFFLSEICGMLIGREVECIYRIFFGCIGA